MAESDQQPTRVLLFCFPLFGLLSAGWLGHTYWAPLMGGASMESVLPLDNCVGWMVQRQADPSHICKLDLPTGRLSIVKLSQLRSPMEWQVGQQFIRTMDGTEIFHAATGDSKWRDASLDGYSYLVGDRFMIKVREGQLQVVDLAPVLGDASKTSNIKLHPVEHPVDGILVRRLWADPHCIVPFGKTNRFLCLTGKPPSVTATVYELSSRGLKTIKAWLCSDAPAILRAGKVWTYMANPSRLEVRAADNFQLLQTIPMPAALQSEMGKWSDVKHHKDLISFSGVKSLAPVVCHLEDLSIIDGLDVPLVDWEREKVADARYHLLADWPPDNGRRIAVYDSENRKLVYDARPPRGAVAAAIVDRELVMVTEAMGLTVEAVDLAGKRLSKRYQPFRWHVLAMPVLLVLGLVWFVWWYRHSTPWLHPLPNIALVTSLFLTPLVGRAAEFHNWNTLFRPAVCYTLAALIAVSFAMAAYVALGTSRFLLRWTGLCVWLSCLGLVLRGLLAIDHIDHSSFMTVENILVQTMVFTLLATLTLLVFKRFGVTPILNSPHGALDDTHKTTTMPMRDLFALTGGIALLVSVLSPCGDYLRHHVGLGWAATGLFFLFAPSGLLALMQKEHNFRFMANTYVILACAAIVLATINLAWMHSYRALPYRQACDLGYMAVVMVGSFGLCSLMRPSVRCS